MSPIEERNGSTTLSPGKSINADIDLTYTNKVTISQKLSATYFYDVPTFYTVYDTSAKMLITNSINEDRSLYLNYYIYFQKQVNKNFDFLLVQAPIISLHIPGRIMLRIVDLVLEALAMVLIH